MSGAATAARTSGTSGAAGAAGAMPNSPIAVVLACPLLFFGGSSIFLSGEFFSVTGGAEFKFSRAAPRSSDDSSAAVISLQKREKGRKKKQKKRGRCVTLSLAPRREIRRSGSRWRFRRKRERSRGCCTPWSPRWFLFFPAPLTPGAPRCAPRP